MTAIPTTLPRIFCKKLLSSDEISIRRKRNFSLVDSSSVGVGLAFIASLTPASSIFAWPLDVLTIVTRLVSERQSRSANAPKEFKNEDVYAYAPELEKLHPDNRHIKDKIRQQLQVLRDMGLLLHPERDCWRLP